MHSLSRYYTYRIYSYLPNKRAGPNKRAAWTNFEILITVQVGIIHNDET